MSWQVAQRAEPDAGPHRDLRALVGESAWAGLPAAVRARFAEHAEATDYHGTFEMVRASRLGRIFAQLGRLIGTPVVPWVGANMPAVVHVVPNTRGVTWLREYRHASGARCVVRSTKVIAGNEMTERLPARLCMPLDVYAAAGVLHFVSRGYFFDLGWLRVPLPSWLSPGVTHVEHIDEGGGSFRFTMTVRHPFFGEVYFQTGRFHAASARPE
jgi:hypothetical protein